jgi:hypothetical protein
MTQLTPLHLVSLKVTLHTDFPWPLSLSYPVLYLCCISQNIALFYTFIQ